MMKVEIVARFVRPAAMLLALAACASMPAAAQNLPPINLKYSSYSVAADGRMLGFYGEQHRLELAHTSEVPRHFIDALLATEDRDFYSHSGVSLKSLGRAIWQTITGHTQGGSTLTMQLAKNLFLSNERTVQRKLAEMEYARELEKKFSKDQILLLYLNTVYFGRGAYGIRAASLEFFGATPDKLTLPENALLIGLLKAPSAYEPSKHPDKALKRRNDVLHNLVETGRLSEREYQKLKNKPLGLRLREPFAGHFAEYVRKEASDILSQLGASLQGGEYRITTTLDCEAQFSAEHAMREQWKQFPSALRNAQIGLTMIDAHSGAIRAMIGGNEASEARGLNRAVQIRRQPGSAFKPFLYGTLLEQGFTLATPIPDRPLVYDSGKATEWRPANDDDTWSGKSVPMKTGIQHSINLVAAHAMLELTTPKAVADFAHRCGIASPLPEFPSLALGTGEVSPLEMAAANAVFANGGMRVKPFGILKIEDRQGRVLFNARVDSSRVLDSATAYLMTDALQAVIDSGTASSVRKYYAGAAAGKTGTTQNSTDTWFVGYTPEISTAIWIGFDNPASRMSGAWRYGGTACAPIWGRMMAEYAKSKPSVARPFHRPETVIDLQLCPESGQRARWNCPYPRRYPVDGPKMPRDCELHDGDPLTE
jgi:1A family penicillin-binding protein